MDIKEAVSKIGWGKTVLFTGAGFSLGANSANGPFKTAGQIAKDLYNVCNVSEDYQDKSINRAAQWFQKKHSDNELISYLQNEFVVSSISDEQRFIGSLNWKRCYTINYDEILEKSYAENRRPLHPTTPSMSVKDSNISTSCLHINGAISRLNKDTIHSEFKLTNESYAVNYVKNTGWWEVYLDYYNAFRSNLSPAEIGEFIRACIEMREGVINYINTPNVSNKKLVQETLDNLNKIINC